MAGRLGNNLNLKLSIMTNKTMVMITSLMLSEVQNRSQELKSDPENPQKISRLAEAQVAMNEVLRKERKGEGLEIDISTVADECLKKIGKEADYYVMRKFMQQLESPRSAMVAFDCDVESAAELFYSGFNAAISLNKFAPTSFDPLLAEPIMQHLIEKDLQESEIDDMGMTS